LTLKIAKCIIVNFLITGGWIVIVWLATNLVERYLIHLDLFKKFLGYLVAVFVIALPIESFLMLIGIRAYGPSASAAFSGFVIPMADTPIEVAFAIPFYFALVISFIKYWEIVMYNRGRL